MVVKKIQGAQQDQSQIQKTDKAGEKASGSHIVAPDEFVKKVSKQGVEFSKRFVGGLKYLNQAFIDELGIKDQDKDEWEEAFRDVISDILEKSGMNYDSIVNFTFKQYKKYLKDHPVEKEKVKEHVIKLQKKLKAKKSNSDGN